MSEYLRLEAGGYGFLLPREAIAAVRVIEAGLRRWRSGSARRARRCILMLGVCSARALMTAANRAIS